MSSRGRLVRMPSRKPQASAPSGDVSSMHSSLSSDDLSPASSLANPKVGEGEGVVRADGTQQTPGLLARDTLVEGERQGREGESDGETEAQREREREREEGEDGVVLEEGIDEQLIIQELYHRVKKSKIHTDNYLVLFAFLLLTSLYLAILYLQADSSRTFQVSTAHLGLLPDGVDGTGGFVFSSTAQVYEWLNDSIIQEIWTDASCGNGVCERPDEYMQWGRFGCQSDCGSNPNVSQIIITITNDFASPEAMEQASWNLCMQYPLEGLCWYDEDVTFSKLIYVNVTQILIPDGNWTLTVNAPLGGVVGSIVFNDTYKWPTEDRIEWGEALVSWGNCAPNRSESPLGVCRQIAGQMAGCIEKYCTVNNQPVDSISAKSGLFVDLAGTCDKDFSSLDEFNGLTCEEIAVNITANNTGSFESVNCNVPTGRRRLLQESTLFPDSSNVFRSLPERRILSSSYSQLLWTFLGATDVDRLENLQIATQRAIYYWVRDSCLANLPIATTSSRLQKFSSFFCTFFGGPVSLEGCAYVNASGYTLYSDQDLRLEMLTIHARMNITRQQQQKFVEIFTWALQSVNTFDTATLVQFRQRLHQLDDDIVNDVTDGCPYVAQVLPWIRGRDYITEVEVGQSVSWLWEDDLPHSLKEEGFGDAASAIFQGMGAGRMVVARSTICSGENFGNFSVFSDPEPCVLVNPSSNVNVFTFTKYFNETGNYSYFDGYDATSAGIVVVKPNDRLVNDAESSGYLAELCAPGCALGMLRNGKCDSLCNSVTCAFDGGDCSCSPNDFGIEECTCPLGQTKASDGTCCSAYGVGSNLGFDFFVSANGPNITQSDANFLPRDGPPLYRYVSVANRVLIGMSLSQTRWASAPCKEGKFLSLYPNCTFGSSTATYGVNPVFLPTSELFNAMYSTNFTTYYENLGLESNLSAILNQQRVPYGFNTFSYQGSKPTFHYFFDINYNNKQATESLQYLIDGFFLDNATKELTVELITYNGIAHYFTLFKVVLTFQIGGKVALAYEAQSISPEPYRRDIDFFRLVLEIIFVTCVIYNVLEEVRELVEAKKHQGTFLSHFQQPWNIVDFASLSIMIAGICLWINFVFTEARPFEIDVRYDIYDIVSWMEAGLFWDIVPPGKGFFDALEAFQRVEAMVYFRTYYIALQGINILLMVLRILKLMDFQPRMGTITRTLAAAMQDLMHFFILFFVVFVGFAMYGHVVFGRTIKEFRSLLVSLNTCFTALLGNDTVNEYLIELKGWELVAGVMFWWAYILLMVFIILNLLIGIIVDAFVKVRDAAEDAPSMPAEVLFIIKNLSARLFTPLRTDKQLLKQLRALGADKKADLRKHAAHYGLDHYYKEGKTVKEEKESQVLKVNGLELNSATLQALLAKANSREGEPEYKLRSKVESNLVADVVFNQYRTDATILDDDDEAEESAGEKMVVDMEAMKRDMAELKEMVRSLIQSKLATQEQ